MVLYKLRLIYLVTGFYVSNFHVQKCKRIWNGCRLFFFLYWNKLLLLNSDVDLILSHYLELGSLYMSGQTTYFFSPFYT